MGILLILAQVVLTILGPAAHVIKLSPWVTWMPAMLFGTLWLLGAFLRCHFIIDRFVQIYEPIRRKR